MTTLGERLKQLRKQKKVMQKSVAEFLELNVRTFQYYETDKLEPNLETLKKLADYFDVSSDYLLGRGVYEQEELILAKRDVVAEAVVDYLGKDVFTSALKVADNRFFMNLLSILVKKIEFKEDEDEIIIYPNISKADYRAGINKYLPGN